MTKQTFAEFDFDNIDINKTELIFRLSEGRGYRFAILEPSVRDHLVDVLGIMRERYSLDEEIEWQQWDYGNESSDGHSILYPWYEENLEEIEFLMNPGILDRIESIQEILDSSDAYFAKFYDSSGKIVIGAKDSQSYKSLRRRKIAFLSDGKLEMVEEPLIQIANDFSCIFDSQDAFIFQAKQFEKIVNLEEAIFLGVESNLIEFESKCKAVKWTDLRGFLETSKSAARYLRSIIKRGEYINFDTGKIRHQLDRKGIKYEITSSGEIYPSQGSELIFIRFLDHSIYDIEISSDPSTAYVASSRNRLKK